MVYVRVYSRVSIRAEAPCCLVGSVGSLSDLGLRVLGFGFRV